MGVLGSLCSLQLHRSGSIPDAPADKRLVYPRLEEGVEGKAARKGNLLEAPIIRRTDFYLN